MPLQSWLIGLVYVVMAVAVFWLEKQAREASTPANRVKYRGSRPQKATYAQTRNAFIRAISSAAVLLAIWWAASSEESILLWVFAASLLAHLGLLRFTPYGFSQAPALLFIAIFWQTGMPVQATLAVLLGKWIIQGKNIRQEFVLAEGILWTMAAFGPLDPDLALWGYLILQASWIVKNSYTWGKQYADLLLGAILLDILLAVWVIADFDIVVLSTTVFALTLVACFHFLRKWLGYRHVATKLVGLAVVACSLLFSAAPMGTPQAGFLVSCALLMAAPMLDGHRGKDKFTPILALVVLSALIKDHVLSDQSLIPMNLSVGLAMGIWVGHWSTRRKTRQAFETSFIILVGAFIGLFGEHVSSSLGGQGAMLLFGAGFMLTNMSSLWLATAIISLGGLMPSAFHPRDIHSGKTDRSTQLVSVPWNELSLDQARGTWKLISKNSTLDFTIQEGGKPITGSFEQIEGSLTIPEDWKQSRMEITVDVSSVVTGYELRDQSLSRDRDFFYGSRYPEARFELQSLQMADTAYLAEGSLFLRGHEQRVLFPVNYLGKHPEKGFIVFQGKLALDRTDFGMPHTPALSDRVILNFSFDFEQVD